MPTVLGILLLTLLVSTRANSSHCTKHDSHGCTTVRGKTFGCQQSVKYSFLKRTSYLTNCFRSFNVQSCLKKVAEMLYLSNLLRNNNVMSFIECSRQNKSQYYCFSYSCEAFFAAYGLLGTNIVGEL